MKKNVLKKSCFALCAAALLSFAFFTIGCEGSVSAKIGSNNDNSEESSNNGGASDSTDEIEYKSDANGTLTIRNNTTKDMVLFEGEIPNKDTILGGVRAQNSRVFDVSNKSDFAAGGWMIIKGMAASEYTANKDSLTKAKIEYSAMATYHEGEKYEAVINPSYTGEYCFKVNNNSDIGIELHKDSFDGEKIAYIGPNKRNYYIYCENQEGVDLFPVYVYYSKRTKTVTTLNSSVFDTVLATPLSVNESSINTYSIPDDSEHTLEMIAKNVKIPYAYIKATNAVPNQGARFCLGSAELKTQGGQDTVSGVASTFEIASSEDGQSLSLYFSLYGGKIKVFVKDESDEDPVIKNGYDYTVTLKMTGTNKESDDSYKATISAGTPRDIKFEIETLPTQQ